MKVNPQGYGTVYGTQPIEEDIDLLAEKRKRERPSKASIETLVQANPEVAGYLKAQGLTLPGQQTPTSTQRPTWDEFFFSMAQLASTMATCPRAKCGAVIVRHKRVLSLGFNGVASGQPHCPSEGEALAEHLKIEHCTDSIHAETNALRNSIGSVYGATIYVYGHYRPCPPCEAELNRVGITDIRHRPGPRFGPEQNWG